MINYIKMILCLLILFILLNIKFNKELFKEYDSNNYVEVKYPDNLKLKLGIEVKKEEKKTTQKVNNDKDKKKLEEENKAKMNWFTKFDRYNTYNVKCPNEEKYIDIHNICENFPSPDGALHKCKNNEQDDEFFCNNLCDSNHPLLSKSEMIKEKCRYKKWFSIKNSNNEYKCPNENKYISSNFICTNNYSLSDSRNCSISGSSQEPDNEKSNYCTNLCNQTNHILNKDNNFKNNYCFPW